MDNKISVSTNNKIESKRLALLLTLSTLVALKNEVLSTSEVECLWFAPHSVEVLKKAKVTNKIINRIMGLGCELEDVEMIIPHELESSIDEIYELTINELKKLPNVDPEEKYWLDGNY